MHEPVGRVHFVVFEKFTSAYLFQIAREKSCDYLLIIYTKNITTTTNFDSARVFQSRPQGFSLQKMGGREKALAPTGHVYSLNIPEKLIFM